MKNEPPEQILTVFSVEGILYVANMVPGEEGAEIVPFNSYLQDIDAPFRVRLTDDEELIFSFDPSGSMLPDTFIPHDSE